MSQTGYSKYETGENDIPTNILIKLSKIYKTSIDYLLNQTDEKKPYKRKEQIATYIMIIYSLIFLKHIQLSHLVTTPLTFPQQPEK